MKKVLVNNMLLIISLLAGALVSEAVVRIIRPQWLVRGYVKLDEELGNILRPGQKYFDTFGPYFSYHVATNNYGFRMNEDVDLTRKLILCMGDSFTFGCGVEIEDSFFYRVSHSVEKEFFDIQFLNAAIPNYATGRVYKYLLRLRQRLPVKGVIYFMSFNDIFDNIYSDPNYRVFSIVRKNKGDLILKSEKVYTPFKRFLLTKTPYHWLNQHSHLFMLLKSAFKGNNGILLVPDYNSYSQEKINLAYDVSLKLLEMLSEYCNDNRIPLLIIWNPCQNELVPDDSNIKAMFTNFKNMVRADSSIMNKNTAFFDPTPEIYSYLTTYGLKVPDMLIHFPEDDHYNKKGNSVFAEAILDKVKEFAKLIENN